MDAVGTLELDWASGYDGCRVDFITNDVICYKCGNNIKFVGTNGEEKVYATNLESVGPLAVHPVNHVYAFASVGLDPTIYVQVYPSDRVLAELKGGAKLEYTKLAFSTSDYIASVSGIPDFLLMIWSYTDGTKLVETELSHGVPTSLSFNPANWRQVCVTMEAEMAVWNIEQSNTVYSMQAQKLKLPAIDMRQGDHDEDRDTGMPRAPTRASTRMSRVTLDLPLTSIAGVKGDEADKFETYQDPLERVVPVSNCWTPSGDIYIGCSGGQLLKIDGESFRVTMLYNTGKRPESALSREASAKLGERMASMASITEDAGEQGSAMGEGAFNSLVLHREGLFAAGPDGVVRRLQVPVSAGVQLLGSHSVGFPISTLAFNPSHNTLAMGSAKGGLYICDPLNMNQTHEIFDIHSGLTVGIDVLTPGTEYSVSAREDGELHVWSLKTGKLVSTFPVGIQICSVAASPLCHVVAVGSASGHLYMVDFNKLENPRLILRTHMHTGPLKHLVYNSNGHFLLTGSDDGHVFVVDGRPTTNFVPLGYIDIPGEVQGIATQMGERNSVTKVVVTTNSTENKRLGATKLIHFDLPDDISIDLPSKYSSLKCDFKNEAIKKLAFNFASPSHGIAVTNGNVAFTLAQTNKHVHKLSLPTEPPKKENSKDSYLHPLGEFEGHGLPGGKILLSPHHKWLASVGVDGKLQMRAVGAMDRPLVLNAHDYRLGGAHCLAFSADSQHVLTSGQDGNINCYKWNLNTSGQSKAKAAIDAARAKTNSMQQEQETEDEAVARMSDWSPPSPGSRPGSAPDKHQEEEMEKEKAIQNDAIYSTPTPTPGADATWLEIQELEAIKQEDKQYAELKTDLRTQIRDMRRQIQGMMKENEQLPEIEKLSQYEFDLDMEEQTRLQAEGNAEVDRIREEKEFDNLAKMYLAELIKKECWDDMVVKGRGIQAFNSVLEVHNYPLKARSQKELDRLEEVTVQRKIEVAELAARREFAEVLQKTTTSAPDDELNENDDVEGEGKEQPSTTGSLELDPTIDQGSHGEQYGGENPLFYSQFELHTREQKMNQIVLLEDAIYRIRVAFNKEFDEVFQKKEQEIAKVKERNKRIRKILADLEQPSDIEDPSMGALERPEVLLTVAEEEVKVEKFLTAEQQKAVEEERKAEEERRLREKGDNARERALDMMMGGVLEVKKEDELKKDVPIPAFMSNKDTSEWSEDEKKAAAEYEKKVKELLEEREKYRKQLETELKKLQGQVQEGRSSFDEALQLLFTRKVKTEMVTYQEELKILRLKYWLLVEEELNNREQELNDLLEFKKDEKQLVTTALNESKKHVEAFRDQYDILVAEDKVMDKAFKREFHDIPAVQVDQLYRLFRRRPRALLDRYPTSGKHQSSPSQGGQRQVRAAETPYYDSNSGNPFQGRPSTARQNETAQASMEAAVVELDKEVNMPEGVEPEWWDRMCQYRQKKITSEQLVKQKALVLADMQAFMNKRQEEEESLKEEIEDLIQAINKLKEDRNRFICNLEVQLLLKQGQVEVDAGNFIHNYKGSLLLHRSVVEDLNGRIRQLGESKISSMVESKDFRKGIIQLEWEHKRMTMEMEDLQNKMRDIQMLKVTREIQAYLNETDHEAKKAEEIQTLEQTLVMLKQHHEKNVDERKKILKELKKTIREKAEENNSMTSDLGLLNVNVNERRHIHEVNADKRSDAGREKRYKDIVQRRKLVDLAKAQAQEVAVLRAEVERLRMRTFPALVQVEH